MELSAIIYIGDLRNYNDVLRPTDSYMYVDTYYKYSNRIEQLTDHQLARSTKPRYMAEAIYLYCPYVRSMGNVSNCSERQNNLILEL